MNTYELNFLSKAINNENNENITELDKDSIIVKMSTESEDGNFNFDLISFQKFLGDDEELKVPEDYKKVRKI
mgnify:CR=1 FL=1